MPAGAMGHDSTADLMPTPVTASNVTRSHGGSTDALDSIIATVVKTHITIAYHFFRPPFLNTSTSWNYCSSKIVKKQEMHGER